MSAKEWPLFAAALNAPLMALELRGDQHVIHAAEMEAIVHAWPREQGGPPADDLLSVCGRSVALMNLEAPLWPPRVKGLAPFSRCRDCFEGCKKKRPRSERSEAA